MQRILENYIISTKFNNVIAAKNFSSAISFIRLFQDLGYYYLFYFFCHQIIRHQISAISHID